MKKGPLNAEEREIIESFTDTESYDILLKVLAHLAERIDDTVLTYDLNRGPDGLVIVKARSEGARLLQRELQTYLNEFKKRSREK